MSKPKESIELEKLKIACSALDELRRAIEKTVTDCESIQMRSAMIEGWPTLARGLQFMLDQAQKFVGSASRIHDISGEDLLMPGQSFAPTKKPYVRKLDKAVEAKLAAGRKAVEAEIKRSRNVAEQSPHYTPPKSP